MSLNLGILLHRADNRNENSDRVNLAVEKNPGDKSEIKVESIVRPDKTLNVGLKIQLFLFD